MSTKEFLQNVGTLSLTIQRLISEHTNPFTDTRCPTKLPHFTCLYLLAYFHWI
jgi:hypothetical protein